MSKTTRTDVRAASKDMRDYTYEHLKLLRVFLLAHLDWPHPRPLPSWMRATTLRSRRRQISRQPEGRESENREQARCEMIGCFFVPFLEPPEALRCNPMGTLVLGTQLRREARTFWWEPHFPLQTDLGEGQTQDAPTFENPSAQSKSQTFPEEHFGEA